MGVDVLVGALVACGFTVPVGVLLRVGVLWGSSNGESGDNGDNGDSGESGETCSACCQTEFSVIACKRAVTGIAKQITAKTINNHCRPF